ncbi:MAG: hypothetical protein WBP41_01405 [Saprospiraceae bacterium]
MKKYIQFFGLCLVFLIAINHTCAQSEPNCCPDSGSLISGNADFANSNLVIENPVITKKGGHYFFSATVANHGDDCSHCTQIIVLLPAEVSLIKYSAVGQDGRKFEMKQCLGALTIDVGLMCPAANYDKEKTVYVQNIKVMVETSDHTANVSDAGFAIMAYSKIPDLVQKDNYWSGRK